MKRALILAVLASASVTPPGAGGEHAPGAPRGAAPHEDRIPVGSANLYARAIGRGQPIVVLHGGPDFDHSHLLPDMDRLMRVPSIQALPPHTPGVFVTCG